MVQKDSSSRLDQLGLVFLIVWSLGTIYLFFMGPASNAAQLTFRVSIFAIGCIGSLAVAIAKSRNRPSGDGK
jgi:hypothetical protein